MKILSILTGIRSTPAAGAQAGTGSRQPASRGWPIGRLTPMGI